MQIPYFIRFNEKGHVKRLIKILSDYPTNGNCPGAKNLWFSSRPPYDSKYCKGCQEFVGVKKYTCPCHALGTKEALKVSWLALGSKGYLKEVNRNAGQ